MIRYPCECSDQDVEHNYLSEHQDGERTIYKIQCADCGHLEDIDKAVWDLIAKDELQKAQKKRANLTRYPYIDPYSGMEVRSKEHREDVWKAHGFHKAEHGINEAYNDEATEKLKEKRLALQKRREETQKKREAYMRAGLIKRPAPALK